MAYVPRFNHDIFISYRHASNEAHDKWIETFCKELRARLLELVGDVAIWRDEPNIRAGDQYRREISAALDKTAIFLAIISRTYFDSDVCRTEMDRFLGEVKAETKGLKKRIVPVLKQPLKPDQKLPQELSACDYHQFFEKEAPPSHLFREYTPGSDEETYAQFWEALERLAQDLMDALEELKGTVRKDTVGTVFLARVGPELIPEREKLRSDLQQRGYLVVPEREYFWNSSEIKDSILQDLAAGDLCVHLVPRSGADPDTLERARLQLSLAAEVMKRGEKPMPLVWIQPSLTTDEKAQELIGYIENELCNEGVEYLEDTLEELKTEIYAKLKPPAKEAATAKGGEIALIVEQGDVLATKPIKQFLVTQLSLDPKSVTFANSSVCDPAALTKTFARCDKCIIYWGGGSEEWVNEVMSLEDVAPFADGKHLCVYAAPPGTPEKEAFVTTKAQTISGTSGINDEELRKFLAMEARS